MKQDRAPVEKGSCWEKETQQDQLKEITEKTLKTPSIETVVVLDIINNEGPKNTLSSTFETKELLQPRSVNRV